MTEQQAKRAAKSKGHAMRKTKGETPFAYVCASCSAELRVWANGETEGRAVESTCADVQRFCGGTVRC